jgi:hypothetical protein
MAVSWVAKMSDMGKGTAHGGARAGYARSGCATADGP